MLRFEVLGGLDGPPKPPGPSECPGEAGTPLESGGGSHGADIRRFDMRADEMLGKHVARFVDRVPDWDAFADARIDGYRRAQHRFIGPGGSGKVGEPGVIPPGNFTLSIMYVEPGQGNAAHTHEVEEVFFVLQGYLTVFFEDESGKRID